MRHRPWRPLRHRRTIQRKCHGQGIDPDYGRGQSAYNRAFGDATTRCILVSAAIDEPPYYAVQVVPGDIGTCGGLVTNGTAQVIDHGGDSIEGLYTTGNGTATVMGRHYLGPGASIASTMVFGYLAARHATLGAHAVSG